METFVAALLQLQNAGLVFVAAPDRWYGPTQSSNKEPATTLEVWLPQVESYEL
jgi:hypothetical protein